MTELSSGMRTTGLTPLAYWALAQCGEPIHGELTEPKRGRKFMLYPSAVCMLPPNHQDEHRPDVPAAVLRSLTGKA